MKINKIKTNNTETIQQTSVLELTEKRKTNYGFFIVSMSMFFVSIFVYVGLISSTIYYNLYAEKNINNITSFVATTEKNSVEDLKIDRNRVSFISLDNNSAFTLK